LPPSLFARLYSNGYTAFNNGNSLNSGAQLEFRAASTVMQYQILTTGECLYAIDSSVGVYEAIVLSQMTALNEARAGLLQDIREEGSVYGRK